MRWKRERYRSSERHFIFCLVVLFFALHCQFATAEKTPRDKTEAQKWMKKALNENGYEKINIADNFVLFSKENKQFAIALGRVSSISIQSIPHRGLLTGGFKRVIWRDYAHEAPDWIQLYGSTADNFKAALDFLSVQSRQEQIAKNAADFEKFKTQAAEWRALAIKPAMPETAHEHQVLAEYAFKQKDTLKAISEYMAALDIFPCWPEGQFNLAALAGENKMYQWAILHMKEYLELVPDAPDAQAGRDSIVVWRDKVTTLLNADANSK